MNWMRGIQGRLAASSIEHLYRHWRDRSRVPSDESKPSDLAAEWTEMLREQPARAKTMSDLIKIYLTSNAFDGLSVSTKTTYKLYLGRITEKFGNLLITRFDERGARTAIRQWRDEYSDRPRTADGMIAVFRVLLNFGINGEYLSKNPAANIVRLRTRSRRDIIWSDEQISTFLARAPRHLAHILLLALWTGQRQSDLLALEWSAFDGQYIRLQQRKCGRGHSGRRVKILVSNELRNVLAEIEAGQIARAEHPDPQKRVVRPQTILTTSVGRPWRKGFKCAWRKAVARAGISGVTFHDLRGTFVTLAHRAGATMREIADASGHDEKECERVLRQHYLASGAEKVIGSLEASNQFADDTWRMAARVWGKSAVPELRFTGPRRPRPESVMADRRPIPCE